MTHWRSLVKYTLPKYPTFRTNYQLYIFPLCLQVSLETVDIEEDGNEEWFNKFRYEIPVFFLDKKFLCKNRIDLAAFHSA